MNLWLLAAVFSACWLFIAQPALSQEEVETAIKKHFEQVPPALLRYGSRITMYGECLCKTRPSTEVIEQEIALYQQALAAGLTQKPSRLLLALCHNLLIYHPETGRKFMEEINKREYTQELRQYLATAALAAGRWGEAFALGNLESPDLERRKFWAMHLNRFAIYEESIPSILQLYGREPDPMVRRDLLRSLSMIGSFEPVAFVKQELETTSDDDIQAGAIFTYVELIGHKAIEYVEHVKPIGPKTAKEKEEGLKWLKEQTRPKSPFGIEVKNDIAFTGRFCDIKSPAMGWLNRKFQTYTNPKGIPDTFSAEDKKELLELLLDAKGFGLEAVKGTLFNCAGPEDVETLLQIRAAGWYSPNNFSTGRTKTIDILVRHIRKTNDKSVVRS